MVSIEMLSAAPEAAPAASLPSLTLSAVSDGICDEVVNACLMDRSEVGVGERDEARHEQPQSHGHEHDRCQEQSDADSLRQCKRPRSAGIVPTASASEVNGTISGIIDLT